MQEHAEGPRSMVQPRCPACGAAIPPQAEVCPNCHRRIEPRAAAEGSRPDDRLREDRPKS